MGKRGNYILKRGTSPKDHVVICCEARFLKKPRNVLWSYMKIGDTYSTRVIKESLGGVEVGSSLFIHTIPHIGSLDELVKACLERNIDMLSGGTIDKLEDVPGRLYALAYHHTVEYLRSIGIITNAQYKRLSRLFERGTGLT